MKVYLAADLARAEDANALARDIEQNTPALVVSRWHGQASASETAAAGVIGGPESDVALIAAERNLSDIDASDIFIVLTTGLPARGGRHFETGYAFARGKPIVVVGPVEHAFQHLATRVLSDTSQISDDLMRATIH